MTIQLSKPADLLGMVGQEIGTGDWHAITQHQVNIFADATHDHQWIHVEPERAVKGPYGGPIAHGYLTLSFCPMFPPNRSRLASSARSGFSSSSRGRIGRPASSRRS